MKKVKVLIVLMGWLMLVVSVHAQPQATKIKAESGDAEAQCELGLWYVNQKDYEQAGKWFRKSAEQGNACGQYNMGMGILIIETMNRLRYGMRKLQNREM